MTRSMQWKLLLCIAVIGASLYALWPSFQFYQLPRTERLSPAKDTRAAKLREKAIPLGLDLQGGMHLVMEVDRSKLPPEEAREAVDRAMEVIRNRIDQFGVAEPLIQKQGEDRIVIQLPGLSDRERAKDLIGKTALLKFQLVRTPDEAAAVFNRLDQTLAARARMGQIQVDTATAARPLTSYFLDAFGGGAFIASTDVERIQSYLTPALTDTIVPAETQLLWSDEQGYSGRTGRWLYVLKRTPEMTGGSVSTASAQIGLEQNDPGGWGVSMKMAGKGQSDFARVTAANVGRQLAIVLDDAVRSAPSIRERIPGGTASITGSFDAKAAKDLEIVLKAGALPAPVRIVEERSVGPSLGQDSIDAGFKASWIATLLVIAFIVLYYRGSGVIAVAALILNIVLLFAGLAGFGATLTLPGIAGIVLTVGMALDTNVLIFERIREELRHGKSIAKAIEQGYDRAFRTILDAHVTTLISAAFLFQFGTGPIKGFAVTLSIGLIANMFTAVFFTRLIYEMITHRRSLTRLSI
ncbi:MAG: protein translocase subunit SecD [Candidatus Eiseniibacteriota bacterium]